MQMGFVPSRGTIDAIFFKKKTMKKYKVAGRKLYIVFVDFDKAFESCPNRSDQVGTEKKRSGKERNKGN